MPKIAQSRVNSELQTNINQKKQSKMKTQSTAHQAQQAEIRVKTIYQEASKFTLLVYFKNEYNKGRKFHSHKQEKRKVLNQIITDQRYAFNRLMHLIEEVWKDKYKTAIIYDNTSNEAIIKFSYGTCQEKRPIEWIYNANGDVLFKFKELQAPNIAGYVSKLQYKY